MRRQFTSLVNPPFPIDGPVYWFLFRGYRLLVHENESEPSIPFANDPSELGLVTVRRQYLGILERKEAVHCYSAELDDSIEAPKGMALLGLRQLYKRMDEELFWLAGRAIQIMDWDRTHRYCSRCGAETATMETERAKQCPQCGFTSYPRLSPAIIVRVERAGVQGPEILLARSVRHPPGLYSVLAGFVEPGETLEECVRREVREEVGIELKNIRYFGSQPWPFPNSLMLAFTAEYAGGDIELEAEEMEEASWYTAETLPQIPPRLSIARQLIDDFLQTHELSTE